MMIVPITSRERTYGFNNEVARKFCLANHSYQISPGGKPWRISRETQPMLCILT